MVVSYDDMMNGKRLMSFRFHSENPQDYHQMERRDPDYFNVSEVFTLEPFDVDGDGTIDGTWLAEKLVGAGGVVWTDSLQGLVFPVGQSFGDHTDAYKRQAAMPLNQVKFTMYVYDWEDLEKVYKGEKQPHEMRGKWYPFPMPYPKETFRPMSVKVFENYLYVLGSQSGFGNQYNSPLALQRFRIR